MLRKSGKAAMVKFVMSNRQHPALLRAGGDRLLLHTLYYANEVRAFDADWKRPKLGTEEVRFAVQYIDALTRAFAPTAFHDEYREALTGIIRAKAKGKEARLPETPKPPRKVIDLVEALRESVAQARKPLAKAQKAATPGRGRHRRGEAPDGGLTGVRRRKHWSGRRLTDGRHRGIADGWR